MTRALCDLAFVGVRIASNSLQACDNFRLGFLENISVPCQALPPRTPGAHSLMQHTASPNFDQQSQRWVLHTYWDVISALQSGSFTKAYPNDETDIDASAMRKHIAEHFSGVQLTEWRDAAQSAANELIDQLPSDYAIDIIGRFARPWALKLAGLVSQTEPAQLHRLEALAREISAAAARPDDQQVARHAATAGRELDFLLQDSPVPLPAPAFVALAQTLPCFLANAWYRLFTDAQELQRLQDTTSHDHSLIDEMLRIAGLARSVSRIAIKDVMIGNCSIRGGEQVKLLLQLANSDVSQFSEPDRFDASRKPNHHVAFGSGVHSCPAGNLIRMATSIASRAVLGRLQRADASQYVRWHGGSGFRWPEPLWVVLRDDHAL